MSERFKINEENIVRVSEIDLRYIVEQIFLKMDLSEDDARIAADVLVSADLRGVESHGVSNMLRKYIRDYGNGKLNPTPKWKIVRESATTASIDADSALGTIISVYAMEIAIKKAKESGIGMVTIRNAGHMGMASYYPMMAIEHDMIGLAMTSTPPEVVPTFGATPRLGTNPIALCAPAATFPPFIFDAATSVVSNNKLGLARRLGIDLPGGWIADSDGRPIMHDVAPPPDVRSGSNLLPLGGTYEQGSHKGYGLACVVEILSGILTGGGFSAMQGRIGYTHCVAAYRIDAFMDVSEFKKTMDDWLMTLNTTKPMIGETRVLYPGQKEAESEEENRNEGIPLHVDVVAWLRSECELMSIPCNI